MSPEPVRISYDPATSQTTVDDRWTDHAGTEHGALTTSREPDGAAGAERTAELYRSLGRPVLSSGPEVSGPTDA